MRYLPLLVVVGAVSSLGAQESLRFTDVSATSGLRIAENTGVGGTNPHAVAVEDFDGDGKFDIVVPTFGKPHMRYFRNKGNLLFADVTAGSGLENFEGDGTGIAAGDFDRDGKLDLYITSLRKGASRLYRGKGDGTFDDVSKKAGVLVETPARSCSWSDVDNDGWPDLYVTSPKGTNFLFRNNKNGTFADITPQSGLSLADRHSLAGAFGDIDGDGLDDLFVTAYQSQLSSLFKNLGGGRFTDITREAGVERKASAVGCVFADVFNRGRLDLFVSTDSWLAGANYTEAQLLQQKHTVEPNLLYVNDGKGRFTADPSATLLHKTLSHDVVLEDLDHDGAVDLYVGVDAQSGNRFATSKGGNPLWIQEGKTWKEVSKSWGVAHEANCVCVPAADFDGDGDLDLLLVNFYSNVVLYRNNTNDQSWLRVRPVGTKSSRDGLGAQVRVYTHGADKRLVGFRQIQSGSGYCRCSPLEAHVGLGKSPAAAYQVEVYFPATKTRVVRDNVQPGQRLVIEEK